MGFWIMENRQSHQKIISLCPENSCRSRFISLIIHYYHIWVWFFLLKVWEAFDKASKSYKSLNNHFRRINLIKNDCLKFEDFGRLSKCTFFSVDDLKFQFQEKYLRTFNQWLWDHFNMTSAAFRPFCYHHPPKSSSHH